MVNQALIEERHALLALELTSLGVDIRRLGFLRWLVTNQQNPEWGGSEPPVDGRKWEWAATAGVLKQL